MITISFVYKSIQAEETLCEVFQDRFRSRQLGTRGHWLGLGAKVLQLQNPVQLPVLENLLDGLTPDGRRILIPHQEIPESPVAWRVTLSAPQVLSTRWAVAPREARVRLERGFAQAANQTLSVLERWISDRHNPPQKGETKGGVLAVFRSGVAEDGSPQLRATAIVLNAWLEPNGKAEGLPIDQVPRQGRFLPTIFRRNLRCQLETQLGQIKGDFSKDLRLAEFCEKLFLKLYVSSREPEHWRLDNDPHSRPERNVPAFADWRLEAQALAWSAQRTERSVQAARSHQTLQGFVWQGDHQARPREHLAHRALESLKRLVRGNEEWRQPPPPASTKHRHSHSY